MSVNSIIAAALLGTVALVSPVFTSPASRRLSAAPPSERLASATDASRAYLHRFNLPAHGVAIEGYSPVSYFEGRAERGSALFAIEHEGVTYHLTHASQVETFKRDPARFVPAFGGWCAFGMAVSDKFPIDPENFQIVGGRLFLFLRNAGVDARALWNDGDERELVGKAEAHWRKVRG